jgi:hypothetical protein
MKKFTVYILCCCLVWVSCQRKEQQNTATPPPPNTTSSAANGEPTATPPTDSNTQSRSVTMPATPDPQSVIVKQSNEVLVLLAQKKLAELMPYIHTTKGVRFSPYSHINTKDRILQAKDVVSATKDTKKYLWGEFDGSGEPMELTFGDYYKRFVYDKDYQNPKVRKTFNKINDSGNSISNIKTVFPDAVFYEYYVAGSNPDYGGMDWGSLTLVWEQENGQWKLVGIVHGQWTI